MTNLNLPSILFSYLKNQFILIFLFVLLNFTLFASVKDSSKCNYVGITKWYIPQEFKIGGINRNNVFYGSLSIYYHFELWESKNYLINNSAFGIGYSNMLNNNYLVPFYKFSIRSNSYNWLNFEKYLKIEPQLNLNKGKIDYLSVSLNFSWFIACSVNIGLPVNLSQNKTYSGFSLGYYFPYPIKPCYLKRVI